MSRRRPASRRLLLAVFALPLTAFTNMPTVPVNQVVTPPCDVAVGDDNLSIRQYSEGLTLRVERTVETFS